HAELARRLFCRFDRWPSRRPSPARSPSRRSCRRRLLPDYLPGEPHRQLSRQPDAERYDFNDWASRDLRLAALSVEQWWGTGASVRNMDSDRETSSLYEAWRVSSTFSCRPILLT